MWPAAQIVHHAYRGGFLEHILQMARVGAPAGATLTARTRDLVLAGVILHDIGKLQELGYEGGGAATTREGNLVGHIALGLMHGARGGLRHPGFPDRAAHADRAPDRLAPRLAANSARRSSR